VDVLSVEDEKESVLAAFNLASMVRLEDTHDLQDVVHLLDRSLGKRDRHRMRNSSVVDEDSYLNVGRGDPFGVGGKVFKARSGEVDGDDDCLD
jgi:hypothetical protein